MNTWGTGIFDNSAACEYASRVVKPDGGLALVEKTLDEALVDETIGSWQVDTTLAAADIVGRLRGNFGQQAHAALDSWVARQDAGVPTPLVAKAAAAVDRVLEMSEELSEFWPRQREFREWCANIEALKNSLGVR